MLQNKIYLYVITNLDLETRCISALTGPNFAVKEKKKRTFHHNLSVYIYRSGKEK